MKRIFYSLMIGLGSLFASCSDELDLVIPHATNITFSELEISQRFSHVIPEGGFTVAGMKFNTVKTGNQLAAGFCYSNRSNRSFVWNNDEVSLDSLRYSVWSSKPNTTGTYLVCHAVGQDAYFTLETPKKLDYVLVAHSTWSYLATYYGDSYGTPEYPMANPNVPSKPKGVWYSYVEGGVKYFKAGDYFSVTATGFLGGQQTGAVTFDLVCMRGHNTENPSWNYFVTDWRKMELSALGTVDKVVFTLDSSDKDDNGRMRTPSWFCLDGFQFASSI